MSLTSRRQKLRIWYNQLSFFPGAVFDFLFALIGISLVSAMLGLKLSPEWISSFCVVAFGHVLLGIWQRRDYRTRHPSREG